MKPIDGLIVGALAVVGYFVVKYSDKVADAAGKVADAVNPTNRENVFYSTANAVGGLSGGGVDFNIGGWLADNYSPSGKAVSEMLKNPANAPVSPESAVKVMEKAPLPYYGGYLDAPIKTPVFNSAGTLTSSEYRDMVR